MSISLLARQFHSTLAPEELLAILQTSTLPPSSTSWRDDFMISPTQPFKGVVGADFFHIIRLSTGQIRRASPLPLTGRVTALPDSHLGSQLVLSLRLSQMELLLSGTAWIAALVLVAASLLRERLGFGLTSLGELLYFLIPACLTAVQYARLRSEASAYEHLLKPLLRLTKQA